MKIKKILLTKAAALIFIAALMPVFAEPDAVPVNKYALITISGSINPVLSEYVVRSIEAAGNTGASFVLLLLDTPGGMMDPMRDIIKAIMGSPVPVVVFTYPKGAQAASAGGFIMLSAHVAAMCPGTEIGAMHPVGPGLDFLNKDKEGQPEGPMEKKVLNDTAAYARSLAQKRNRNADWAVKAVHQAVSNTYIEALKLNIIDIIADDIPDLLSKLNGRKTELNGKSYTFSTKGIERHAYEMDWKERMLNALAHPQVMMYLLMIAVAGIGIEFKSPGMIVPGVVGALSLIMFLMAVKIIPVNLVGLALIILAIVLFILELQFASYGLLTLGGLVSFAFGALLMFDSPLQGGGVPMGSIVVMGLTLAAFFFVVVRAVIKVHKGRVVSGLEGMTGEKGEVTRFDSGRGKMFVHGELWDVISEDDLKRGDRAEVIRAEGMLLYIKKADD
jgi:membrane-bound serine protease (ClpP class)